MSETAKNKKKGGEAVGQPASHPASHSRKNTRSASKKGGGTGGDFRIGSRDILESPEILSPFGFDEESAVQKPRKAGKKAVQDIASECGIQDVNYFIKLFKRQTGLTPNQYRRNCR
jgi:AraC-like DNA-binding protein